jgi:uncharacterized protein YbjQ (UPF0145 family)
LDEKEISEHLKLIEELQKEKVGNKKDLEEVKEILEKEKDLDESDLKYLTKLDVRLHRKREKPIISTTDEIQGKTIDEYIGVVSGHAVMGMNFITDFIAGIRDVVGGRSGTMESYFLEAREKALDEMIEEAMEYDADAIVAVRFNDVSIEGKGHQMALVGVHGTAVRFGD